MEQLKEILINLKNIGCCGIKISFEDEGALYNEVISMRNLTTSIGLDLSVKIGGCEAKRDIIDCIDLNSDSIVAPMIESEYALIKFLKSLEIYNYQKKKGFNLETINSYNNLKNLCKFFSKVDFITVGRVDFVCSMGKDRNFVDNEDMYNMVKNIFKCAKEDNILCYLGGAITINSKNFIKKLIDEGLLDNFETRYIIYDIHKINFNDFEKLLYLGNIFEVEWLKYISSRYFSHANKDINRIKIIEERILTNKF